MDEVKDPIETLTCGLCPPVVMAGFNMPFTVERLCLSFGENLGGNAPDPSWFEGYDIVAATRRTMDANRYSAVAALLRRRSDGALRLVASDHIAVRKDMGADFMIARQHSEIVSDALLAACDDGEVPKAVSHANQTVAHAVPSTGEGPVDILSIRRERDDLADIRARRDIAPAIAALEAQLLKLSSPDRRAKALRMLEAISSDVG